MFENLEAVPQPISEFYVEVVIAEATGNTVAEAYTFIDEDGVEHTSSRNVPEMQDVTYIEQIPTPESKDVSDLQRVLRLGKKTSVIDTFISGVLTGSKWVFLEDYITWYRTEPFQDDEVFIVYENELIDDTLIYSQPLFNAAHQKWQSLEPVKPLPCTVDEYKSRNAKLFASYNKKVGVDVGGYLISLNKDNTDGLVAIKSGYDLAGDLVFPTNFVADVGSSTVSIAFDNYGAFSTFAFEFLAKRGELFK